MSKIFNFLKQLFGFVNTTNVEEVHSTSTSSFSNVNVNTVDKNTVNEDITITTNFVDVFGNALRPGEMVVPIIYNDSIRRGYYTVKSNYELIDVASISGAYISHKAFVNMAEKQGKISDGRKHGFIHVAAN